VDPTPRSSPAEKLEVGVLEVLPVEVYFVVERWLAVAEVREVVLVEVRRLAKVAVAPARCLLFLERKPLPQPS
jgi:hypothetical protein